MKAARSNAVLLPLPWQIAIGAPENIDKLASKTASRITHCYLARRLRSHQHMLDTPNVNLASTSGLS